MTMMENSNENLHKALSFTAPACSLVRPFDIGVFGGAVDYREFSPHMRLMIKAAKTPEGDYRDWEAIHAWAANLKATLTLSRYPNTLNADSVTPALASVG